MKLLSIEIKNCFRYESDNNIFKFDYPLILIVGENGAGKSSIFEAICFALFEKTIRWGATHEEIIRRGTQGGSVILRFEKNGIEYEIKRGRELKVGTQFLYFKDITKGIDLTTKTVKNTNEEIIKVVGFDFTIFKNTVLFGQYDFKKIVSLQPAERLDLLAELLNLQILKKCYDLADSKAVVLKSNIEELTTVVELSKYKDLKDELKSMREIREAAVNELNTNKQSFSGIQEARKSLGSMKEAISKAKAGIKTANAIIEEKEQQLKRLSKLIDSKIIKQLPNIEKRYELVKAEYKRLPGLENLISEMEEKIAETRESLAVSKNSRRIIKNKIKLIKKRKKCLECSRPYDDLVKAELIGIQKNKLKEADIKFNSLLKVFRDKTNKIKELKINLNRINDRESPEQLISKIEDIKRSINLEGEKEKIDIEIKNKKETLIRYEEIIKEVREQGYSLDKLEKIDSRLLEIKGTVSESTEKLKQIDNRLEEIETLLRKIKSDKDKIDKYGSKVEVYNFITNMFSRSGGIKQIIVENILPRLNSKINKYLEALTNEPISIDFTTTAKTKSGKDRDKLDIMIWTPEGRAEFESYSGGEKQSLILAIGFGFAEVAAESVGTDCKFILLDEVFSSLDGKARNRLIQLLYMLQSKFENIVVISHIAELKAQIPVIVTVKRKQGSSRIIAGEK